MQIVLRTLFTATLSIVPVVSALQAQTIHGVVVSGATGQPIADASIVLLDKNGDIKRGTLSNPDGSYSFEVPEPGTYTLRVGGAGLNTWNSPPLEVRAGQDLEMPIRVTPEMTEAGTVDLRAFYARMAIGKGEFITPEQIERSGGSRFTDVVRYTTGVFIVPFQSDTTFREGEGRPNQLQTATYFTVRIAGSHFDAGQVGERHLMERERDCPAVLWVDGIWWGSIDEASATGPDYRLVPSELAAIEIYTPSIVPEEFDTGTDAECGVVVVWRKVSGRR